MIWIKVCLITMFFDDSVHIGFGCLYILCNLSLGNPLLDTFYFHIIIKLVLYHNISLKRIYISDNLLYLVFV